MRFVIIWCVFSAKNSLTPVLKLHSVIRRCAFAVFRKLLRYGNLPVLLWVAKRLCSLGLLGRAYRRQNAVATQNFRSLTGLDGTVDAAWIATRRSILEVAATWARHPAMLRQIADCSAALDSVVAPLHQQNIPVVLAPLHAVSDVLAAMVGAGVTPGRAGVVVSSSAEVYNQQAREMGNVSLTYCSIHQNNTQLASSLMSLIMEVASGERNLIIFPDITPDYTVQTEEGTSSRLSCRLFNRPAQLHSGVARLSRAISAQVVFYHLYYQNGLRIHIHTPVSARKAAARLPDIIEQQMREYPQDWLLWHSHSLYFINH
jgi:lauroyl/myristoyl acyltransferase